MALREAVGFGMGMLAQEAVNWGKLIVAQRHRSGH